MQTWQWVVTSAATLIGALTGWYAVLLKRRINSGNIETSAASDLWAESRAYREMLANRVVVLEARIVHLEDELATERNRHHPERSTKP